MFSSYPHSIPIYPIVQDQMCRLWPQLLSRCTHYCSSVGNPSANRRNVSKTEGMKEREDTSDLSVRKHLILGLYLLGFTATCPQTSNTTDWMSPGFELLTTSLSQVSLLLWILWLL